MLFKHIDRDHTDDATSTTADDAATVNKGGKGSSAGQNHGKGAPRSKNAAFKHIIAALRGASQRNPDPRKVD